MKISVVVPSYRNPKYLDLCLKSAFENQDNSNNQIIVVLDGYVDESKEVIAKYPGLDVLEFEENRGQAVGHNMGVMAAENEFVLLINSDNVLPRHWDSKLQGIIDDDCVLTINQIERTPSIFKSIITKDLGATPETFRYDEFLDFEEQLSTTAHIDGINDTQLTNDAYSWPIFLSKKLWMTVGGMDTMMPRPQDLTVDWDLFIKLQLTGASFYRYHGCHIYHFYQPKQEGFNDNERQSHDYLNWKWGSYFRLGPNNERIPVALLRGINW